MSSRAAPGSRHERRGAGAAPGRGRGQRPGAAGLGARLRDRRRPAGAVRLLRRRHRHLPHRTQPDQPRPAVGRAGPARRRDDGGDDRRRVRPLGRGDPRLRRGPRRRRRQRGRPRPRRARRGRRRGRAGADQRHDRHPAADPVLPRDPGDPVRDRRGRDLPHRRHQQLPRRRLPRLPEVRQQRAAGDPVQGLDRAGRLRRDLGPAARQPLRQTGLRGRRQRGRGPDRRGPGAPGQSLGLRRQRRDGGVAGGSRSPTPASPRPTAASAPSSRRSRR